MKLVILDRDGTLNERGEGFITSTTEWVAVPGALEAIARLNHAGWHVVLVTNQPGLGRGLFDVMALNAIHAVLMRQLGAVGGRIDAIFYCPHAPEEACSCREPAPGLLEQVCERYGLEGPEVLVAGSSPEHLQAGANVRAQLHLVCTGDSAHLSPQGPLPLGIPAQAVAHASLRAFADHVLGASVSGAAPPAPQPTAG